MFQKNKKIFFIVLYFIVISFNFSCDFTPYYLRNIKKGQSYLKQQKYKKAALVYEDILKQNPPAKIIIRVKFQLAKIYSVYLNKYKKSLKLYYEIISIAKTPIWIVKSKENIANISFYFLKDYNLSRKSYKELLGFKPRLKNYEFYYFRYLYSIFYLNKYKTFRKKYTLIQKKIDIKYVKKLQYLYGITFFYEQKYKRAIKEFTTYLSLKVSKEKSLTVKLLIANCYESLENLDIAYSIYYKLKNEFPNEKIIIQRINSIYRRKIARQR